MIIDSGWIRGVRKIPSPNCDLRPIGQATELIVVHGISLPPGQFGGGWIEDLFVNALDPNAHPYFADVAPLRVSAHVLIDRGGELTQFVSFDLRAWHAGQSSYRGRAACNDFSVGIELEGSDDLPYTDAQYDALGQLVAALRGAYPTLRDADIVGHADIAPGRKTDPGSAFDWSRLERLDSRSRS